MSLPFHVDRTVSDGALTRLTIEILAELLEVYRKSPSGLTPEQKDMLHSFKCYREHKAECVLSEWKRRGGRPNG